MIPLWAIALLKNKWTWIMLAAGVLFLVSFYKIVEYGNDRFKAGQMAERVVWQEQIEQAVTERNRLNASLRRAQAMLDSQAADLRAARAINLQQTQDAIHEAETVDDIYRVYIDHHNSVRDQADADLARARADYLSSLNPGNDPSPGGNGFADRVLINPRTSRVLFEPGSVVGYGIG